MLKVDINFVRVVRIFYFMYRYFSFNTFYFYLFNYEPIGKRIVFIIMDFESIEK